MKKGLKQYLVVIAIGLIIGCVVPTHYMVSFYKLLASPLISFGEWVDTYEHAVYAVGAMAIVAKSMFFIHAWIKEQRL